MEEGGKDCEEETLQTAFKKLRVDAESVLGTVSVSESLSSRSSSRSCLDVGAKPKLSCSKDNWHGSCMRKSTRCSSRSQRRRRSKSPILHPPKFTYCSAAALSPPGGCLKHQRLTVPEPVEPLAAAIVDVRASSSNAAAQTELPAAAVFGSCVRSSPSSRDVGREEGGDAAVNKDGGAVEKSACDGAAASPSDFRSLSELHGADSGGSAHNTCRCAAAAESQEENTCRCRSHHGWNGVEVYSFTGLRDVISECERKLPTSHDDGPRTLSTNGNAAAATAASTSSGSPRSCSEQARGYVDDITIEDLSGYMEFYLYIPKKMSHMAEMMYT